MTAAAVIANAGAVAAGTAAATACWNLLGEKPHRSIDIGSIAAR
jgi:hypothetical protein